MRQIFFFLLLIGFLSCRTSDTNDKKIIGVKIYNHEGDLNILFQDWENTGINTLFVSPDLARKPGFMELARQHQMPVFLIVPTFFKQELLNNDSSLYAITSDGKPAVEEWVQFVCPSRRSHQLEHLEYLRSLVREIQPDGMSIDFIRYFVFWEKVYPDHTILDLPRTCFDDTCLMQFQQVKNIEIPDDMISVSDKVRYILNNHGDEWADFKCTTIGDYVKEIEKVIHSTNPNTIINFHAVPWASNDFDGAARKVAGQDLSLIAPYVDYISPMCYAHMVKQDSDWVKRITNDMKNQVPDKMILPSIQVGKAYLENKLSNIEFRENLEAALMPPSSGVVFWSWDALALEPEKKRIVKETLESRK